MNTLGKLLTMHELKAMPSLFYKGRIVSVNLMRQYTNISQENVDIYEPSVSIPLIPEKPKRPPTAYILFYREFLSKTRKGYKKLNVADAAKLAGAGWARLSPDDKNVYIDQYKKKVEEYKKVHDEWSKLLTPKVISQENKRRRLVHEHKLKSAEEKLKLKLIKDPSITPPPKTPYAYYIMKRMNDDGTENIGLDKLEEYVFDWEKLTPEDKQPYVKDLNEETIRYEQQMKVYRNLN
ncbi:HMG-box [Rhizophagus irregularis]|uniref:HMG-box n=1 Tax=Rhizophagus irregularis TaxID=588596 RepID=A0A2N1N3N4_9GLOM|nr:HMG-box [Rhizophagus irregularis]PKC74972.1 HMG-box [Rhizophagus irregularis]PKK68469.1 HMG-box [Rhizophagus irregularis]CAB4376024.1 unnamed protein product [Rhizophagus irregularis]CAB4477245.1 unnamed protein product [Rhizophagus irregularis]